MNRYTCTAEAPWTPEKGAFVQHDNVETREMSCGCCERKQCRNCGQAWTEEVPD